MSEILFGRSCRLVLGTTQILLADSGTPALACTFHVTKNLKAEPNTVEIKVRNLAPATRKALETPKVIPVQLDVGYGSTLHTIYLGQLRGAVSARDGQDIVTSISSGDNEGAFSFGRTLAVAPAQTSPAQLLAFAAQGLQNAGVLSGNLSQAQGLATATTGGPARVYHGSASKILTDAARSNGLEWSVQDGKLQFLKIGAALGTGVVSLSSSSGLVGSPSVDSKGILKAKALIQPDLLPGRTVVMDAEFIKGAYRIEQVEFIGDTWGDDWFCDIEARKWK